ncbi:MAG: SpoIIE family protein phosphatase, partial [Saccharofermentanales bacterium]
MKFYEDIISQNIKTGGIVCGDHTICSRSPEGTIFVLCDGIGSGIYANIAAISCSNRIVELLKRGVSVRATAEMVASSMHRARTEDVPFSAFSAIVIMPDGQFSVFTYEAPEAIIIKNGTSSVLKPEFFTAGYEVVGEAAGVLDIGDSVVLCSDGVTQAGLGHGHGFGIGISNVSAYINSVLRPGSEIRELPSKITD